MVIGGGGSQRRESCFGHGRDHDSCRAVNEYFTKKKHDNSISTVTFSNFTKTKVLLIPKAVRKSLIDPYEHFLDKGKPNYLKMVCFFRQKPILSSIFLVEISTKNHEKTPYSCVRLRAVP